jgi:hypothetical protein
LPEVAQKTSLGTKRSPKETPWTGHCKARGQRALDDAFHAMFELSRTKPAVARLEKMLRLMS